MVWVPPMMPTAGAMGQTFEIDRVDYLSPETSGALLSVSAGWPRWTMKLDLNNMDEHDADIWRTFIRTLRGAQRPFLAFDLWRTVPRFHERGIPFSANATSWSQAVDSNGTAALTLNGLMPDMVLSLCDYVGFKWDAAGSPAGTHDRRALASVSHGGVVNAGGSVTVNVEPPIPNLVPSTALAHLDEPCCLMRLSTTDTKLGRRVLDIDTESGGAISAGQDLRA